MGKKSKNNNKQRGEKKGTRNNTTGAKFENPLDEITSRVSSSSSSFDGLLDLYQPRDWPHRRGDRIDLSLHAMPLKSDSPGNRSHPCELCGRDASCIHDNVLCWKCKGAFCLLCYARPESLMTMSVSLLLKNGFATCKVCQEPLRSIGMVDLFRTMLEANHGEGQPVHLGGGVIAHEHTPLDRPCSVDLSKNFTLLQEAEDAIVRAEKHAKKKRTEAAILEFTHALNAVNYLSSSTGGTQLVLTAKDVLLHCHTRRAELEGNNDLAAVILIAYPKCSARNKKKGEKAFSLTKTAFSSLFYPLPTKYCAGSDHAAFLVRDQRHDSNQIAERTDFFLQQKQILENSTDVSLKKSFLLNVDGADGAFDNRNGTWKGLYAHEFIKIPLNDTTIGKKTFNLNTSIQFIWAFETEREANDYKRHRIETGTIGEENTLHFKHSPQLSKDIKKRAKQLGAGILNSIYVITETSHVGFKNCMLSIMAGVGNVITKIFIGFAGSSKIDGVEFAARALAYLDHWLLVNRYEKGSPSVDHLNDRILHTPDMTLCTYCGSCSNLKTCTRCRKSKYCSVACQQAHFQTLGPFGHKKFCKMVAKSTHKQK